MAKYINNYIYIFINVLQLITAPSRMIFKYFFLNSKIRPSGSINMNESYPQMTKSKCRISNFINPSDCWIHRPQAIWYRKLREILSFSSIFLDLPISGIAFALRKTLRGPAQPESMWERVWGMTFLPPLLVVISSPIPNVHLQYKRVIA